MQIKRIQRIRNFGQHLTVLVFMVFLLQLTVLPIYGSETTAVKLTVSQKFHIKDGAAADEATILTYKLTAAAADTPMPADSTAEGYQFSLKENQSIETVPITYFEAGIYEYRLELLNAIEKTGFFFDHEVYFITVYVKNTPYDSLVTSVMAKNKAGYKVDNLTFEHSYQPLASESAIMTDPPVKKTVSGSPANEAVFRFSLQAEKNTNPMPEGSVAGKKEIIIRGEGESEFGVWSYENTGIYRYTVTEENTGEAGYRYDKTVYTITDIVNDRNGQLVVTREITDDDETKTDTCAFQNHYNVDFLSKGNSNVSFLKKNNNIAAVKTGDSSNIIVWSALLFMTALGILKGKRRI